MADLAEAEAGDFRNFPQRESREVVQVNDASGRRIGEIEPLHEDADLHDGFRVAALRRGRSERRFAGQSGFSTAAALRDTVSRQINEDAAHRESGNGEEMLAIIDGPAAFAETAQPHLVDELGGRNRGDKTFAAQFADGNLMELGKNGAENFFGDLLVSAGVELKLFGERGSLGHGDVAAIEGGRLCREYTSDGVERPGEGGKGRNRDFCRQRCNRFVIDSVAKQNSRVGRKCVIRNLVQAEARPEVEDVCRRELSRLPPFCFSGNN